MARILSRNYKKDEIAPTLLGLPDSYNINDMEDSFVEPPPMREREVIDTRLEED